MTASGHQPDPEATGYQDGGRIRPAVSDEEDRSGPRERAVQSSEEGVMDGSTNVELNGVTLPDGRKVSWADAFPIDFAELFKGIEPPADPRLS